MQEITAAFATLSDAQERAWYDAHRESILAGVEPGSVEGKAAYTPNLWPYFSGSAYSGFGDSAPGFYGVYRDVFSSIATSENTETKQGSSTVFSPFGDSQSAPAVVTAFYACWDGFSSQKSFAPWDEYNPLEAPNRMVRRAV